MRNCDSSHSALTYDCTRVTALAVCLLSLLVGHHAFGQTETVLHNFGAYGDGATPYAPLAPVYSSGAFTGATSAGGDFGGGTIFGIDSSGDETLIFPFFGGDLQTGVAPYAEVIFDSLGNIYGTTSLGGEMYGTVFEILPANDFTETVLHDFACQGVDGCSPITGLAMDATGNLYGTTISGGTSACGCGTVYSLSGPDRETETILHSFSGPPDGSEPWSALLLYKGSLYGTTSAGGTGTLCSSGCGTVFKISGTGKETVVYSFSGGADGSGPRGALIDDSDGNLYGTTMTGGALGQGTVFRLTPSGKETVLYNFTGVPDGAGPEGPLLRDDRGNLYGVAIGGGSPSCQCGTVFELKVSGTERTLHTFGSGADGQFPNGGLSEDQDHSLYGTTSKGGTLGYGTVFKITP